MKLSLVFRPQGWEDYRYWQDHDRAMLKRLNRLIEACLRSPYDGIGQPEQLKYGVIGGWSRRIDEEHRLVYQVSDGDLVILQARYHYGRA